MNILCLDPGSSCGYCVATVDTAQKTATIIDYGVIEPDTSSLYQGDHCISLQLKIQAIINKYSIKEIGLENYFASSRFCQGTDVNYYFRAAIMMQARNLGLPYEVLNISNWKMFVALRSTPPKDMKQKYGKELSKKILIVDALWKRFGIRLPNHSLSPTTGKPIAFRYDCSDAIGQCLYFCALRYDINSFQSTVSLPKDVVFKKKSKKVYEYT